MDSIATIQATGSNLIPRFGILGSGFGMYGYAPAVRQIGYPVLTLERYKDTLFARTELKRNLHDFIFFENEQDLIEQSDYLVIARQPSNQYRLVMDQISNLATKKHLFLEKPLTNSVVNSSLMLNLIEEEGVSFTVAYLFKYSAWFRLIHSVVLETNHDISIEWEIPRTSSDWKNSASDGGGPLSFYGVHFLWMLIHFGVSPKSIKIESSVDTFHISSDVNMKISIFGRLVEKRGIFMIRDLTLEKLIFEDETPLGSRPNSGRPDPRIGIIAQYLEEQIESPTSTKQSLATERAIASILAN